MKGKVLPHKTDSDILQESGSFFVKDQTELNILGFVGPEAK